MALFPPALRDLLQGTPWGEVFPPRPNPRAPAIDGRTAALRVLRKYIANLDFYRENAKGKPPIQFRIPEKQFFIEWPNATHEMTFPSIAVVHSRADYDVIGLNSYVEEETRDLYAPGTVLQWQAEYVETINLEIWAAQKSERRGILAALETAFSPTEQMSGVRFKMPDYFDELVCFTLERREVIDEPDSARNRRRAQLELEMRFNIVALVNYVEFDPSVEVSVDVDQYGVPITIGKGGTIDPFNDGNAEAVDGLDGTTAADLLPNGSPGA